MSVSDSTDFETSSPNSGAIVLMVGKRTWRKKGKEVEYGELSERRGRKRTKRRRRVEEAFLLVLR
jgi:hypothetical protein